MKKIKRLLIGLAIVAVTGIVLFGINNNRKEGSDDKVIRIGAILPLTGKYADNGTSVKCGIALAVDELNLSSTAHYEVSYFDTKPILVS